MDFEDLTAKMSELSWKMLNTIPPLVSAEITDSPLSSSWHDKEMKPLWDDKLEDPNYNLVYYRPILFFSYEGKVAQKGWVGNKPLVMDHNGTTETCQSNVEVDSAPVSSRDNGNTCAYPEKERVCKSYKGPSLKATGNGSHGYELLDLNPELSRIRELESTVVLDDSYIEVDSEQTDFPDNEQTASPDDSDLSLPGLRKFL